MHSWRGGMKLTEFLHRLLQQLPGAEVSGQVAAGDVLGVTSDSRGVKPGYLFVAITGTKLEGLRFVAEAIVSGAMAVIAEKIPSEPLPSNISMIKVPNARLALALAAAQFYRASQQRLRQLRAPAARPPSPHSRGKSGTRSASKLQASALSVWFRQ